MRRWIEGVLCVWLACCVLIFVTATWSWPLTGDASLMHYVVFLMRHGMEPYRDLSDMNLPGSYMVESSVMAVLGAGSMGWRLYDFLLLAVSSVSLLVILRPKGLLAGTLAAALFALIHGRDGALMAGERDLAATALLLAAVAMLFLLFRRGAGSRVARVLSLLIGLTAGMALTIKPTLLPLLAGLFFWAVWMSGEQKIAFRRLCVFAVGGASISLAATLAFLIMHHAVDAFREALVGLIPYHASINRRTLGHLLIASIQPLAAMLLLWVLAAYLLRRRSTDPERVALIVCAVCGLLSYLLQMKAFWYHRYPFLAFLLALFVFDFTSLVRSRGWGRLVGIAGMATGIFLTTVCLVHLRRYDREEPPREMLRDLSALGTPRRSPVKSSAWIRSVAVLMRCTTLISSRAPDFFTTATCWMAAVLSRSTCGGNFGGRCSAALPG